MFTEVLHQLSDLRGNFDRQTAEPYVVQLEAHKVERQGADISFLMTIHSDYFSSTGMEFSTRGNCTETGSKNDRRERTNDDRNQSTAPPPSGVQGHITLLNRRAAGHIPLFAPCVGFATGESRNGCSGDYQDVVCQSKYFLYQRYRRTPEVPCSTRKSFRLLTKTCLFQERIRSVVGPVGIEPTTQGL